METQTVTLKSANWVRKSRERPAIRTWMLLIYFLAHMACVTPKNLQNKIRSPSVLNVFLSTAIGQLVNCLAA